VTDIGTDISAHLSIIAAMIPFSLFTAYQILMSKSCFYNSTIDISRKIWYNKSNQQAVLCIKKEVKQNECNYAQNR
jgi:hypothetical protein